jgi:hypothetical protein
MSGDFKLKMSLKNPSQKIRISNSNKVTVYQNNVCVEDFYISKEKFSSIDLILSYVLEENSSSEEYVMYNNKKETNKEKIEVISSILKEVKLKEFLDISRNLTVSKDENTDIIPIEILKMVEYSDFGFCLTTRNKTYRFLGKNKILLKIEELFSKSLLPLFSCNRKIFVDYNYNKNIYQVIKDNEIIYENTDIKNVFDYLDEYKIENKKITEYEDLICIDCESRGMLNELSKECNFPLNLYEGFNDTLFNFNKDLNNTSKVYISHVPYVSNNNNALLVIPKIEEYTIDLINDIEFKISNLTLKVKSLNSKEISLKAITKSNVLIDKKVINKNDVLTFKMNEEHVFNLDSKDGIETWNFVFKRGTFKKEYRRIHFEKIKQILEKKDNFKNLTIVEKYETYKSILLFLYFINQKQDEGKLDELYSLLDGNLYEEFLTDYNIKEVEKNTTFKSFNDKKIFVEKVSFVDTLVKYNWLSYPRYIFSTISYFNKDKIMRDFDIMFNQMISKTSFKDYLIKLFEQNSLYQNVSKNFEYMLNLLSNMYYVDIKNGEDKKYYIEKLVINNTKEDDLSYSISVLVSAYIRDEKVREKYLDELQEKYRKGDLKEPLYIEKLEVND